MTQSDRSHGTSRRAGRHASALALGRRLTLSLLGLWVVLVSMTVSPTAWAHTSSTATLSVDERIEWQAAWRDLDALLDLDANADGQLTWGEAEAARPRIEQLAGDSFVWRHCPVQWTLTGSQNRGELGHARLQGEPRCAPGQSWQASFEYRFLQGVDPSHRLVLRTAARQPVLLAPGQQHEAAPGDPAVSPSTPEAAHTLHGALDFFVEGMVHILRGIDHVVFVLTLVLPLALVAQPAERRQALRRLVWVITAFTAAHSITLAMSALQWWSPPAEIVEPAIAASICVAAVWNLWLRRVHGSALLAFAFGLLHGFGFAEVLAPLELSGPSLLMSLGLFNLGVEAGQLLIVLPALLLIDRLGRLRDSARRSRTTRWLHDGGSAVFAVMGLVWFVQRVV